MPLLSTDHPLAVAAITSIRTGDVERLRRLLAEHPELAGTGLGDRDVSRTLLHVVTDWPGHVLSRGAVIDWLPPWERATPLDAAQREGAVDLVSWLRARGAHAAAEL